VQTNAEVERSGRREARARLRCLKIPRAREEENDEVIDTEEGLREGDRSEREKFVVVGSFMGERAKFVS